MRRAVARRQIRAIGRNVAALRFVQRIAMRHQQRYRFRLHVGVRMAQPFDRGAQHFGRIDFRTLLRAAFADLVDQPKRGDAIALGIACKHARQLAQGPGLIQSARRFQLRQHVDGELRDVADRVAQQRDDGFLPLLKLLRGRSEFAEELVIARKLVLLDVRLQPAQRQVEQARTVVMTLG